MGMEWGAPSASSVTVDSLASSSLPTRMPLALHGLPGRNPHEAAQVAAEILERLEGPVEAGRGNFQHVGVVLHHVLGVEQHAQVAADLGAILDADAALLADIDPQDPAAARPEQFDVDEVEAIGPGDAFRLVRNCRARGVTFRNGRARSPNPPPGGAGHRRVFNAPVDRAARGAAPTLNRLTAAALAASVLAAACAAGWCAARGCSAVAGTAAVRERLRPAAVAVPDVLAAA